MGLVKDKIYLLLTELLKINSRPKFVPNINLDVTKKQKKVLISYLDIISSSYQIMPEAGNENSGTKHTNRYELFQIIKAFINMDYCIDVCAHYDKEAYRFIDTECYDVIFGLGEVFRYAQKHSKAFKIIYMTENPYYISYQMEKERTDYFMERHGKEVPLYRTGMFFKKDEEKYADAVICLGDSNYYNHLSVPIKRITPSSFCTQTPYNTTQRNKSNFLVFGTDGFVHKGIDLLIEVFNNHPEWNLYLCGHNVTEDAKSFGLELNRNIHDAGYVTVDSNEYVSLIEKCTFILMPSCSEGFSTGVATCTRHGMIPVVTKGNGWEMYSDYCIFFEGYRLKQIEQTLEKAISMSDEEIKSMSIRINGFANKEFTLESFTHQIQQALQELL